jgi:hypothetical protein
MRGPTTTGYARVRVTPATETHGLAGRVGAVVGETRPSHSGVAVIGDTPDDFALAVLFEGGVGTHWFPPALLEPVNRDGSPFVPPPSEPWHDRSLEPRSAPDETPLTRLLGWLERRLPRLR